MRSTRLVALVVAWVLLVLLVPFAIHVIAPFASMFASIAGGGLVGLGIVIAARLTKEKKPFDSTTVFDVRAALGNLAIVVGGAGVVGFLLFDHWHENLWVHDGLPDNVTISIDGHELGPVTAGVDHEFENIPVNAERIIAADAHGKPIDTVDLDDAEGNGQGSFVFDVGGQACWQITEVTYSSSHELGGDGEARQRLSLGTAHLFRAKSDFVGDAPTSVSSKSSSETRTLLELADCAGGR